MKGSLHHWEMNIFFKSFVEKEHWPQPDLRVFLSINYLKSWTGQQHSVSFKKKKSTQKKTFGLNQSLLSAFWPVRIKNNNKITMGHWACWTYWLLQISLFLAEHLYIFFFECFHSCCTSSTCILSIKVEATKLSSCWQLHPPGVGQWERSQMPIISGSKTC